MIELRKKGLLYLRNSISISPGAHLVSLIKYTFPKYDEVRFGKDVQTKAAITHIGNATATNLTYHLSFGDKWDFQYQIGKTNDPFPFPVPLDIDSEDIIVTVDNDDTSAAVAEIVIVGYYDRERFKKLEKQIPNSLGRKII